MKFQTEIQSKEMQTYARKYYGKHFEIYISLDDVDEFTINNGSVIY